MIILISINGCSPKYKDSKRLTSNNKLELYLIEKRNNIHSKYGLALSGGGIRSSLFTIGVLKALYDKGYLNNIDIISSVSGGGYSAYWLYIKELEKLEKSKNYKFGDNTFGYNNFAKNSCDLILSGSFVTYRAMFKALISPNETLPQMYERKLNITYSNKKDRGVLISRLNKKDLPYLIMNTTLEPKNSKEYTRAESVIEFTPLLISNKIQDAHSIRGDLKVNKVTAISGASVSNILGVDLLAQSIEKPKELNYIKENILKLSDGGKSENLGALALILRGVENIIIVDAEYDPKYEFEAYFKLKRELYDLGLDFFVDDIENKRFNNSVHLGSVTSCRIDRKASLNLKIYYIKMSTPNSIIDKLSRDKQRIGKGSLTFTNFFNILKSNKAENGNWDCEYLPKFKKLEVNNMLLYSLNSYYNSAKKKGWSFPQYPTLDQSFYLDQSLAFIGLGYFQAEELDIKMK